MKSPDDRSPLERVLASELARSADSGRNCPDAELLAAFYDRTLTKAEHLEFERHISTCGSCQERLAFVALSEPDVQPRPESVWNLRTLVPLFSSAAAVIFVAWIATRTGAPPPSSPATAEPAPPAGRITEQISRADEMKDPRSQMDREIASQPGNSAGERGAGRDGGAAGGSPGKQLDPLRYELRDKMASRELPNRQLGASRYSQEQNAASERDQTAGGLASPATPPEGDAADQAAAEPAPAPPPAPAPVAAAPPPAPDRFVNTGARKESEQKADAALAEKQKLREPLAQTASFVVQSPDPSVLWRVEPGAGIGISRDGGITWTLQVRTPGDTLVTGVSPSPGVAWMAGSAGAVWQTREGAGWRRVPLPVKEDVSTLRATDALHATALTSTGATYLTANGGQSWAIR